MNVHDFHGQIIGVTAIEYAERHSKANMNEHNFPPFASITRPTVETAAAAFYMNRKSQTLRLWSCLKSGPIRPVNVNGRLAWRVEDIRKVMAGE